MSYCSGRHEDNDVDTIANIIRLAGKIGEGISGWVYVSAIEQALPIGGDLIQTP